MGPDRTRFLGVDFSGARDAGDRIVVAECMTESNGFRVKRLFRARDLPQGGPDRKRAHAALVAHVAGARDAVVGVDVPFGIPGARNRFDSWPAFLQDFGDRYADAEAFRSSAREAGGSRERKRATDVASAAPFAPANLRMFRQTFHGIRDVLAPLVRRQGAVGIPMMDPVPERPWLIETCPASFLKREGLNAPYKGRGDDHVRSRHRVLACLARHGVRMPRTVASDAREDPSGDALDAILAAWIAWEAVVTGEAFRMVRPEDVVEGRVYPEWRAAGPCSGT